MKFRQRMLDFHDGSEALTARPQPRVRPVRPEPEEGDILTGCPPPKIRQNPCRGTRPAWSEGEGQSGDSDNIGIPSPKNYSVKPEPDHSYSTGSIGKGEGADMTVVSPPTPKIALDAKEGHFAGKFEGKGGLDTKITKIDEIGEIGGKMPKSSEFQGDGSDTTEEIPF